MDGRVELVRRTTLGYAPPRFPQGPNWGFPNQSYPPYDPHHVHNPYGPYNPYSSYPGPYAYPPQPTWGAPFPGQIPVHSPYAMPGNDFLALMGTIQGLSFESTKQQALNAALTQHYFSASQVAQMLNAFDFESTKLAVAKQAYPRTVDPQNYHMLFRNFDFDSSVSDLNQFIAMR
jgi:Domain of unknown function (DUF4476)